MSSTSSYTPPKFEGWGAFGKDSVQGNFKWFEYEPKKWAEDDVELKIMYCGICASDVHTASSGWFDLDAAGLYPAVVGHEIVGEVLRVGDSVKDIKVGEIVGVGAQCDSCQSCHWCDKGREQYCAKGHVGTYAGKFYRDTPAKGDKSYGGYANFWRGPSRFTVKIPEGVDPAHAAPMMCGGATVFSPLEQYGAGTTAKDVGIVGIGGLGHFGLLFAKAMGANVTAISHGSSKVEDAKKMGASNVIITGNDAAAAFKGHERTLDLIICTANDPNLSLDAYIKLIRPGGTFVLVGAAETDHLKVTAFPLIMGNVHITGSAIGSPTSNIPHMLKYAAEKNIQPWIKKFPMDQVNKAVPDMHQNGARYRYVLVNEHHGGKL